MPTNQLGDTMTQAMITLRQILDAGPCTDGWRKVRKANGGTKADYTKSFPLSSILDSNGLEDTLWALRCLPDDSQLWRRFAWWCASSVVHLSIDEDAQFNLDVIDAYIKGDATDEQLKAVSIASAAASYAAASDARYASYASHAASSADLSGQTASAAASDARYAARDDASEAKQVGTLRQLLDHGTYPPH